MFDLQALIATEIHEATSLGILHRNADGSYSINLGLKFDGATVDAGGMQDIAAARHDWTPTVINADGVEVRNPQPSYMAIGIIMREFIQELNNYTKGVRIQAQVDAENKQAQADADAAKESLPSIFA